MRQAKRETLWKEIETEGNGKNMKQTDFIGKERNDYKKGKQGDTQKKKRKKRRKIKDPTKRN